MIMISAIFIKNIVDALKIYSQWHKNHELLGFLFYILLYLVLVPIAYPPAQIITLSAFVYGSIYGKLSGFFICFGISLATYPIVSVISF